MKFSFLVIIILLVSCTASKEASADKFFKKWEQDSEIILGNSTPKLLGIAVNKIASIELCENNNNESYAKFPKLKYSIIQENINVSLFKNLSQTLNQFDLNKQKLPSYLFDKVIYEDSISKFNLNCNSSNLKPLILTDEYKKKINGKLIYGLGSLASGKNQENARAILESHHTSNNFTLKFKVTGIKFNQKMDSAFVETSTIYDSYGKLYVRENDDWKYIKEIYHLVE